MLVLQDPAVPNTVEEQKKLLSGSMPLHWECSALPLNCFTRLLVLVLQDPAVPNTVEEQKLRECAARTLGVLSFSTQLL